MIIKFVTINILHGGILWDNLIEFLHNEKPDILSIQEVHNSHDTSLDKRFRTMDEFVKEFHWLSYSVFEPTMIEKSTQAPWGNAILSKFPIKSHSNYFFGNKGIFEYDFVVHDPDPSAVTEGVLEAEIDINGRNVFVYSWHGVWDRHGNDTPARFEMRDVVLNALSGKRSVILAGDTNLVPNTQFVKDIEEKAGLTSVFGETLASTFNMLRKEKPGYATAAVDMVFVSRDFRVISKEMPKVDISDHYPLVVTMEQEESPAAF